MTGRVEEWGTPLNYPSLLGVYLAVNAVADAHILVDGPDCALYKAHFIHGRHDWSSTLLDVGGRHRVAFTNVCSRGVVLQHDETIGRHVRELAARPEAGLLLVTALPMCSITGVDYGRVLRGLEGLKKPAVDIPPSSLIGDWLDGYGQTLHAAAKALDWGCGELRPGTVAVVGCMMDRNEGDHRGNIQELRRLLAGLSLELVSVWPGGESFAAMSAAREASLIISLPYGRRAASYIAERTGARLVEAPAPFGLAKTESFLSAAAQAAGRTAAAEAFHAAETRRVVSRLKWVLPYLFLNKRVAFIGDPYLLDGFLDIAEDAGLNVRGAIATGSRRHGPQRPGASVLFEPAERGDQVRKVLGDDLDLLVSCHRDERREDAGRGVPVMEFGFPSYKHHVFADQPFLGYNGILAFLERMAACLQQGRQRCTA